MHEWMEGGLAVFLPLLLVYGLRWTGIIDWWRGAETSFARCITWLFWYSILVTVLAAFLGLGASRPLDRAVVSGVYNLKITQPPLVILSAPLSGPAQVTPSVTITPDLPTEYSGYFDNWNWLLFPFWWILIALPVYATWHPLIAAWESLRESRVLRSAANEPVASIATFQANLARSRRYLIGWALLFSVALNVIDTNSLFQLYKSADLSKDVTKINPKLDWTIAALVGDQEARKTLAGQVPFAKNDLRSWNMGFDVIAYAQQVLIGAFGLLALLQIFFHCYVFWFLQRARSNTDNFRIVLDYKSPLHEFGLERWNDALNNFYWILVPALLIPIASKSAQAPGPASNGQVILRGLVAVLAALPMVATIVSRQRYVRETWAAVRGGGVADEEQFHQQLLWPLDKNWVSKLGVIITFLLLSYLLGVTVTELFPK